MTFKPAYPPHVRAEAVRRYREGDGSEQIATDLGMGPRTVLDWVRAAGVPIRAPYRPKLVKPTRTAPWMGQLGPLMAGAPGPTLSVEDAHKTVASREVTPRAGRSWVDSDLGGAG